MQKYSGQYLIDFLNDEMRYYELEGDDPELEGNDPDRAELLLRLSEAGAKRGEHSYHHHQRRQVQYLTVDALERLDDLIGAGFDPRSISREDLYSRYQIGTERRTYDVFPKATIDALVSRGFAFDEKDLIVLDETKEPVLSKIPELIRGIEE